MRPSVDERRGVHRVMIERGLRQRVGDPEPIWLVWPALAFDALPQLDPPRRPAELADGLACKRKGGERDPMPAVERFRDEDAASGRREPQNGV
jgi:hypothetical protein